MANLELAHQGLQKKALNLFTGDVHGIALLFVQGDLSAGGVEKALGQAARTMLGTVNLVEESLLNGAAMAILSESAAREYGADVICGFNRGFWGASAAERANPDISRSEYLAMMRAHSLMAQVALRSYIGRFEMYENLTRDLTPWQ